MVPLNTRFDGLVHRLLLLFVICLFSLSHPLDGIFSAPGTLAAGTGAGRHWHQREDRGYQRRLEECRLLCLLGPPHFGDSWDPDSMWQPRALTYVDGPI